MTGTEISHVVGDFLLQADHQARHKFGGLGPEPVARRALFAHVGTYMFAFVPGLVRLTRELSAGAVLATAALIAVTHLVTDDGRLLRAFALRVKGLDMTTTEATAIFVDQSAHVVTLYLLALLAAGWGG